MKKLLIAVVISIISIFVFGGTAGATNINYNDPGYWETTLEGENVCYKHEADDAGNSSNAHGYSAGNTVTLNAFDQSWPGDHFSLLVVKGGSVDNGNGPGNNVYPNPSSGVAYSAPNNAGGNPADVSHWIVCKGTTPDIPEEPELPEPLVEYSEWEIISWVCEALEIEKSRMITTTPYIWDEVNQVPVLDHENALIEFQVIFISWPEGAESEICVGDHEEPTPPTTEQPTPPTTEAPPTTPTTEDVPVNNPTPVETPVPVEQAPILPRTGSNDVRTAVMVGVGILLIASGAAALRYIPN